MGNKPVLLIRASGNESDKNALDRVGLESVIDPFLSIGASKDHEGATFLLAEIRAATLPTWVIATSTNSLRYWADIVGLANLQHEFQSNQVLRFAAIGSNTAGLFREYGAKEVLQPSISTSQALLAELSLVPPSVAIMPIGNLTLNQVQKGLKASGWSLTVRIVYTNESVTTQPETVQGIERGEFGAIILRSPSAVRALLNFVPYPKVPLICGGQSAAAELLKVGLHPTAISEDPAPKAVAQLVARIVKGGSQ